MKHENVSSSLNSALNGLEKTVLITADGNTFEGIGLWTMLLTLGVSGHGFMSKPWDAIGASSWSLGFTQRFLEGKH